MSEDTEKGPESETAPEANDIIETGAGDDTITAGEGDEVTEHDETEARADEALAKAEGPQHGTHNAAMAGLQTDADPGYTHPSHPRGDGY